MPDTLTPSVDVVIADAVASAIASANLSFGTDPNRAYAPTDDLKSLRFPVLNVLPAGLSSTSADRSYRQVFDYTINVVIQRKVSGSDDLDGIDAMRQYTEEITEHFYINRNLALADGRVAKCISAANAPSFDGEELVKTSVFLAVVSLVFRLAPGDSGDSPPPPNRYTTAASAIKTWLQLNPMTSNAFRYFVAEDEEFPFGGRGLRDAEIPAIRLFCEPTGPPEWLTPNYARRPALLVASIWDVVPNRVRPVDLWDRIERALDPVAEGERELVDDYLESFGIGSLRVDRPAVPSDRWIDDSLVESEGRFRLIFED